MGGFGDGVYNDVWTREMKRFLPPLEILSQTRLLSVRLYDSSAERYRLESSRNLLDWSADSIMTNQPGGISITLPIEAKGGAGTRFYRASRVP